MWGDEELLLLCILHFPTVSHRWRCRTTRCRTTQPMLRPIPWARINCRLQLAERLWVQAFFVQGPHQSRLECLQDCHRMEGRYCVSCRNICIFSDVSCGSTWLRMVGRDGVLNPRRSRIRFFSAPSTVVRS